MDLIEMRYALAGYLLASCLSGQLCAQMQASRFTPVAVRSGAESTITVEGKFPHWPVECYCDRSDVQVSAGESGKLTVQPSVDAGNGVAWIRLGDEKSLSSWLPVLLTEAPVATENEPNEKRAQANRLELPCVVAGKLEKRGDSDVFGVSVDEGQRLVVSLTGNEIFKSPMDAVLQLSDVDGNILLQSDDARGLDPQLVYLSPRKQDLLIRVFAFPETPNSTIGFAGGSDYVYALTITHGPFVDHIGFVEANQPIAVGYQLPNDVRTRLHEPTAVMPASADSAGAVGWGVVTQSQTAARLSAESAVTVLETLPASVTSVIDDPNETHRYQLDCVKGKKYRMESRSHEFGFLLDSVIKIVDPKSGSELANNDDVSRGGYDAGVTFTAKTDGPVEIQISDLYGAGSDRHVYELSVFEYSPGFRLTIDSDHHLVKQGESIEMEVKIDRDSGFEEDVQIDISGLPEGFHFDSGLSKGKDKSPIKLKLTASKDAPRRAQFKIVGISKSFQDKSVQATYSLRPSLPISEMWLTVSTP